MNVSIVVGFMACSLTFFSTSPYPNIWISETSELSFHLHLFRFIMKSSFNSMLMILRSFRWYLSIWYVVMVLVLLGWFSMLVYPTGHLVRAECVLYLLASRLLHLPHSQAFSFEEPLVFFCSFYQDPDTLGLLTIF